MHLYNYALKKINKTGAVYKKPIYAKNIKTKFHFTEQLLLNRLPRFGSRFLQLSSNLQFIVWMAMSSAIKAEIA
jgi:hypothetical protein